MKKKKRTVHSARLSGGAADSDAPVPATEHCFKGVGKITMPQRSPSELDAHSNIFDLLDSRRSIFDLLIVTDFSRLSRQA